MSAIGQRVELVRRSARLERLRARAPRYLFIATLAVTSLVGLRELVSSESGPAPSSAPLGPDHALEDFAQGFARAYLAYDAARPQVRERALRPYLPDELDPGAGFTPPERGARAVEWVLVAQNQEALAGGRIIVVAAGIARVPVPTYLAVPLERTSEGAIALTGYPSIVGSPTIARAELAAREEVEDREVLIVAERVVRNYLARERADLAADLAPDAAVAIPPQRFVVESVEEVAWAAGADSGAVLATVTAGDEAGGLWTLTYELGVERRRGRVVVSFVETVANAT
ncbi:MAG: conjugal transfer protein [Actinomycetota bacterium]